ncbi:hypothetical protein BKA62DRAFT_828992 [Auriculariales sp. MPI-PUGE-AT-0066]|nr:hypothetical protein BKA62DRAFT_828992 [Auriculariales sp. MPI-PUGE-AT-0066]
MPSEETNERIMKVVEFSRTLLHYGWVPFIIYVGYTRSTPQPSLIKCVIIVVFVRALLNQASITQAH